MLNRGLEAWGKSIHRFRWLILIFWITLLGTAGWFFYHNSNVLSGGGWDVPNSESLHVRKVLAEQFDGRSETSLLMILKNQNAKAGEPAFTEQLKKMLDYLGREVGVDNSYSILNAAESMKPRMISDDGHTTYAFINMNVDEDYAANTLPALQEKLTDYAKEIGVESYLIGDSALWGDIAKYSREGLARAEMIVFPLIFIILLIVFRSIVAAVTPMIVTLAAVVAGMGVVYLVGSKVEMSIFVTNSAMMLGIGVGIDYSLFMVNRFRQELESKKDINQAMGVAMLRSGHSVLFSGITVIAAMIALFVIKVPAIKAIAFGAIVVVLFAVLATLTLLPAILTMLGEKINKGRIPRLFGRSSSSGSIWGKLANQTMKKPVVFLVVSLVVMGIFSSPAMDMKLKANDASILPEQSAVRSGIELYTHAFATGGISTNSILISVSEGKVTDQLKLSYITSLQEKLMEHSNIKQVSSVASFLKGMTLEQAATFLNSDPAKWPEGIEPMINRYMSRDGKTAVIDMTFSTDGSSDDSLATMKDIRDRIIPQSGLPEHMSVALGGNTPRGDDMNKAIYNGLFPALSIMLGLIFLILLVTFKSVLLPLKASLMNLLSVSATFGVVTWVFAEGNGIGLFGASANGYITNFVPPLMLALLLGLSTDYEVFLVSRIKEQYEETGNHEESIKAGIQRTGPLISGAAILMIAVFTGFAFSSMLPIQTMGFGLAVAILLDATIVRLVIVPTAMKLLGRWSWWFPGNKSKIKALAYTRDVQINEP